MWGGRGVCGRVVVGVGGGGEKREKGERKGGDGSGVHRLFLPLQANPFIINQLKTI